MAKAKVKAAPTALVKKEESALAVPEYMKQYEAEGGEDIKADLIGKSFLKALQKSSKDFDAGVGQVGDFIDSVSKENYGNSVRVAVVKIDSQWRKFNDKNQLEGMSSDGEHWDDGSMLSDDEKWKAMFLDFFVVILDEELNVTTEIPLVLSFSGTSFKSGKNWHTQIAKLVKAKKEPIFGRSYTVFSETESNDKGTFAVIKTKLNSGFTPEVAAKHCHEVRELVRNISADLQTQEEDTVIDADAADLD